MIKQALARHGFALTPAPRGEFTVSCGRVVMLTASLRGVIAWMRMTNLIENSGSVRSNTKATGTTAAD